MIIKRITVRNFGKLQDRTMEFSDGINVLYGDNESGKTTTHTFVRSMLYGIQRQRGRAARKDAYNLYLPWENSADYGGTLWFENGGKNFRLTRNFYKENPTTEFLCEDDGEILDVAQGDLDAVLGGISETVYENNSFSGSAEKHHRPGAGKRSPELYGKLPGSRGQLRRSGTDHADAENGQKRLSGTGRTEKKRKPEGKEK